MKGNTNRWTIQVEVSGVYHNTPEPFIHSSLNGCEREENNFVYNIVVFGIKSSIQDFFVYLLYSKRDTNTQNENKETQNL